MPTKRRKLPPARINQPTPAWAQRLVNEGVLPQEGEPGFDQYFGWAFMAEPVPGLPLSDSPEGSALWSNAHARQAGHGSGCRRWT